LNRREARGGPGEPSASDDARSSLAGLVLAIFGPTASGKSAVAEAAAERIPAVLLAADSMQVYRGVPILTNQPDARTGLVAVWSLDHEGSVGEYAALAHRAVDEAIDAARLPIVVGGTGLYLRAALAELRLPPAVTKEERARWERVYDRLGPAGAHALLMQRDPGAAAAVHRHDRRRVVRALELAAAGGSLRPQENRLWSSETRHPTLIVGLDLARAELRTRIATRTRRMVEQGAAAEARRALAGPLSPTARELIGLRELTELPLAEATAAIEARTSRYAAYQRKWMRRIPGIVTVDAARPASVIADEILEMARTRQRLPARRAG